MRPPEDTLPRRSWLELWFERPWRGLLTWVVLASIGEANWDAIHGLSEPVLDRMALLLGVQVPNIATRMWMHGDGVMIASWFVPFALRLSPWRSVAWFGVELGIGLLWISLDEYWGWDLWQIYYLLRPAALVPVLYGWRSRPWMCLVSGGLLWLAWVSTGGKPGFLAGWKWVAVLALVFAAPLLYGTRLLRPEDRRRCAKVDAAYS